MRNTPRKDHGEAGLRTDFFTTTGMGLITVSDHGGRVKSLGSRQQNFEPTMIGFAPIKREIPQELILHQLSIRAHSVFSDLNIPRIYRSFIGASILIEKTRRPYLICCGGYVMSMHALIAGTTVVNQIQHLLHSPLRIRFNHRLIDTGSTVHLEEHQPPESYQHSPARNTRAPIYSEENQT